MNTFQFAAASVAGRSHVHSGRNNQDSFAVLSRGETLAAVVADGCGSAGRSEAGAILGARLCAAALLEEVCQRPDEEPGEWLEAVRGRLLSVFSGLAEASGPDGASRLEFASENLLFTLAGACVTERGAFVFALGDAVLALNGRVEELRFANSAPPYLAYALPVFDGLVSVRDDLRFRITAAAPLAETESVLAGTDGVADFLALAPLEELLSSDDLFARPWLLERRLRMASRVRGEGTVAIPDDTTLVLIRRNGR